MKEIDYATMDTFIFDLEIIWIYPVNGTLWYISEKFENILSDLFDNQLKVQALSIDYKSHQGSWTILRLIHHKVQIHISQSKWTVTNLILQTISNYKFQRYLLEIKWSAHSQCQRIYSKKRKVLFIECRWSGETLLMANQAKRFKY